MMSPTFGIDPLGLSGTWDHIEQSQDILCKNAF
jgi:hypothetical protein